MINNKKNIWIHELDVDHFAIQNGDNKIKKLYVFNSKTFEFKFISIEDKYIWMSNKTVPKYIYEAAKELKIFAMTMLKLENKNAKKTKNN